MSCMPSKYISFYVWLSQGLTIPYYHLAVWVLSGRTLATTRGLEHNIQSHRLSRSFDSFIQKHKNAGFSALILILLVVARQSESILRIDSTRYGGCDYHLETKTTSVFTMCHKKAIKTQPVHLSQRLHLNADTQNHLIVFLCFSFFSIKSSEY